MSRNLTELNFVDTKGFQAFQYCLTALLQDVIFV